MAEWLFLLLNFKEYVLDTLSCLMYTVELISVNLSYILSYNDLLVDIAESFGVWVTVLVLLSSHITVLSIIHNSTNNSSLKNKLPSSRTYNYFLKYWSFRNKL